MAKPKRRKSAVVDNSQPAWKLMRDFHLDRWGMRVVRRENP